MDVQRKYTGLRTLALIFKIIAWIALLGSIAYSIWFWFQDYTIRIMDFMVYRVPDWAGLSIALPIGIFTFLQFYLLGSLISLLVDTEQNTRANATATAQLIQEIKALQLRTPAQSTTPSPAVSTPPPPPPPPPVEDIPPAVTTPTQETVPVPPPTTPVDEPSVQTAPPPPEPEPDTPANETLPPSPDAPPPADEETPNVE